MKIRNARLTDAKQIFDLLVKTPELQGSAQVDAVYSEEFVNGCIKDKKMNLVLVAEEDKRIVGFLIAEKWDKKKYSFLDNFAVLEEYRSKGIGTKMYEAYEEDCKRRGFIVIISLVHKSNKIMQKFCDKKGYKKGHELYFYEKDI